MTNSSFIAQSFYNEYLELKKEIEEKTKVINYCSQRIHYAEKVIQEEEELKILADRLRFVLSQLRLHGVNLEDLILLSIGVEINIFNK